VATCSLLVHVKVQLGALGHGPMRIRGSLECKGILTFDADERIHTCTHFMIANFGKAGACYGRAGDGTGGKFQSCCTQNPASSWVLGDVEALYLTPLSPDRKSYHGTPSSSAGPSDSVHM
jgi:hypothetical protein